MDDGPAGYAGCVRRRLRLSEWGVSFLESEEVERYSVVYGLYFGCETVIWFQELQFAKVGFQLVCEL